MPRTTVLVRCSSCRGVTRRDLWCNIPRISKMIARSKTEMWEVAMLWTLVVVLFVMWALGFGVFHVAGGLIHLLLVVALIAVVWNLLAGRRAA